MLDRCMSKGGVRANSVGVCYSQCNYAPLGAGSSSDRLHWRATEDRHPALCVVTRRSLARDAVDVVK